MWKVMTYNIHGCVGMDGVMDVSRIANVIKQQNADFICLNEVDVHCVRTQNVDQLGEISRLLNMNGYFACALKMTSPRFPEQGNQVGEYGNGLLSPHRIEVKESFSLPGLATMEPRVCTIALIHAPHPFYVAATHFCWEPKYADYRMQSVEQIIQKCQVYASEYPAILCGDLNANPSDAEIQRLQDVFLLYGEKAGFQATHPANCPVEYLDYIGICPRKDFQFTNRKIIPEQVASDHRPLVVEIEPMAKE